MRARIGAPLSRKERRALATARNLDTASAWAKYQWYAMRHTDRGAVRRERERCLEWCKAEMRDDGTAQRIIEHIIGGAL